MRILFASFLLVLGIGVFAQNDIAVTGKVTEKGSGEPLIGVAVVVEGTQNGTVTSLDGGYTIQKVPKDANLIFTYIGYKNITRRASQVVNVEMEDNVFETEEVVVIGYGTAKKRDLTGSIASVNATQLANKPSINPLASIQGLVSGVQVVTNGRPGQDPEVRIRGTNSVNGYKPLYVVDGLLTDNINYLNPADIESISILKDASSAAIYGSRAANGVVLVKTKGGQKGKVTVSYNGYVGFNQATELPEMCDSWEYAELYNKAMGKEVYTAEEIQKYKDGSDPYNYPNEHYLDKLLGNKGLQTGHELTVNGGNDKTQYMVSFGYVKQNGLMKHNHYDRYNGRVNLTTELAKNLTLTTRLGGVVSKRSEPSTPGGMDSAGFKAFSSNALRFPGLWATKLEDGSYGLGPKVLGTPLAWLDSGSFYDENFDKFRSNVELAFTPVKGLTLKAIGGYNYTGQQIRHYRSAMEITGGKKLGPSSLSDTMYKTVYKTFQALADYNVKFSKNDLSVLVGYTWEDESQRTVGGSRLNFPSDEVPYLNAGGADGQTNSGGGYDWAIMSVFGRLTYNYDQRYLFETTMRYDGSSRFPTDNKFGFFPSVAAGWRLSEEQFFKEAESLSFIDNLKLKASYGILGNNNIGNYPYQSTYALGKAMNYLFGRVYTQVAGVTSYVYPTLKW